MARKPVLVVIVVLLAVACGSRERQAATPAATNPEPSTSAAAPPTQAAAASSMPTQSSPPPAQAAGVPSAVLASQETNWPGVTADVTEFRRKGNTLTAKIRLSNRGSAKARAEIRFSEAYLIDTGAGKKYQVLKDEQNSYIASLRSGYSDFWYDEMAPSASQTIWMKFPAPPPDVKSITLQMPGAPPFDDLQIQE